MQQTMTRRQGVALAVLVVAAIGVGGWYLTRDREGSSAEGAKADRGAYLPDDQAEARQGMRVAIPSSPVTPTVAPESEDQLGSQLRQLIQMADAKEWEGARALALKIRAFIDDGTAPERKARVIEAIRTELGATKTRNMQSANRVNFFALSLPYQAFESLLLADLFTVWISPLASPRKEAWAKVSGWRDHFQAREALTEIGDVHLCLALAHYVRVECSEPDAIGSRAFAQIIGLFRDKVLSHATEPALSQLLFEVAWGKHRTTPQDYAALLEYVKPLVDDERYSSRLRLQARTMMLAEITGQRELLDKLRTVSDWSEADLLIGRYLKADPQLSNGLQDLLAVLLERIHDIEVHRALQSAFAGVTWLESKTAVDAFATAVVNADIGDSPEALFLKLCAIGESAEYYRFRSRDLRSSILFRPEEMDFAILARKWIERLHKEDVKLDNVDRGIATIQLFGIISGSTLDLLKKLTLLQELVERADKLDPFVQGQILPYLNRTPVNDMISQSPSILKLWETIVQAPFERPTKNALIQQMLPHSFRIFKSSEYLLRVLSYPRITPASERALLSRYNDAMSLDPGSPPDPEIANMRSKLEVEFASLVDGGYFK